MLAELEKSITERVRSVIPTQIARVRSFSETTQLEDGRAETLGSIVIGYTGSSFTNQQPPYGQIMSFSVVSSLKNLRTHQPSLQILDLIRGALVDFFPGGVCSSYFAKGLAPQSENFIKLEKDGTLYLWEQVFTLIANGSWDDCCNNPQLSYAHDLIGFYALRNSGLIEIKQKLWRWVRADDGSEVEFPDGPEANIVFASLQSNALVLEQGTTPLYYCLLGAAPQLLCTRPETGEVVDCQLGIAPTLGIDWSLERVNPVIGAAINER